MVIVQLTGGLGNQLFQYAAAKSLSLYHNVPLLLEISSFCKTEWHELEVPREFELHCFAGIHEEVIKSDQLASLINLGEKKGIPAKFIPAYRKTEYMEPHFHYDRNFFKSKMKVFLKGGWQSEKYFQNCKDEIRKILQPKEEYIVNVKAKADEFLKEPTVGVHIRRGDYLRKKIILEWHGIMERDYYVRAFEQLSKSLGSFRVLYFSNDIDWVEKELQPIVKGETITDNVSQTHVEDLYLMSCCRHNIIANSSFSWWGAWLNNNPNKIVIAPKKWFNKGPNDTQDLIPEGWIKI
jgi:hypothetical protein